MAAASGGGGVPPAAADYLFRFVHPSARQQLQLDHEAVYSVTDQYTADRITADLVQLVGTRNISMCDATACIGGNTYSFAKTFDNVVALEVDPVRHEYLCNNMRVLGARNVLCRWEDAVEHCAKHAYKLIFVDPPWGGPAYKSHPRLTLYLSGTPIQQVFRAWAKHALWIALKAPTNFDLAAFLRDTEGALELVHSNHRLRKVTLYVFKSMIR